MLAIVDAIELLFRVRGPTFVTTIRVRLVGVRFLLDGAIAGGALWMCRFARCFSRRAKTSVAESRDEDARLPLDLIRGSPSALCERPANRLSCGS